MISLECDERRVGSATHYARKVGQVLRPRALVDDEDVPGNAGLRQSRTDRRRGILGTVQRQNDYVRVI
jgi:hypothetical protein